MKTIKPMRKNNNLPLGYHKIINYINALLVRNDFLNDVLKIRKSFDIPSEGYKIGPLSGEYIHKWPRSFDSKVKQTQFNDIVREYFKKYKLGPLLASTAFLRYFIFFNKINLPAFYDLCAIEDNRQPNRSKNRYGECLYNDFTHPISIRVTPEAKIDDIIDFVRKKYKTEIKPLQVMYRQGTLKDSIGSFRSRDPIKSSISDIIFENNHKSNKEIMKIISNRFPGKIIGSSEITKLKSIEKQRRNK